MIKKKSKMNKIIMWGLIATASVSLASVGFASWVINTIVPSNKNNINVSVGKVGSKDLKAVVNSTTEDLTVRFDNNGGPNYTNGDEITEKLSFTIDATFSTTTSTHIADVLGGVEFQFTVGEALTSLIGTTDATKYIEAPSFYDTNKKSTIEFTWNTSNVLESKTYTPAGTFITSLKDDISISGADPTITFRTTFTFKWGKAFLGDNPSSTSISTTGSDTEKALTRATLNSRLQAFRTKYEGLTNPTFLSVIVTPVLRK